MKRIVSLCGLFLLFARLAFAQSLGNSGFQGHNVGAGAFTTPLAASFTNAPAAYRFLGDGSEGAINCSGNLIGEHWVTNFTVSIGNTCTDNFFYAPLVIRATGTCNVQGTINARGVDGGNTVAAVEGGAGGGGGFGAANGTIGASTSSFNMTGSTAGAAGTSGVPGGNGNTPSTLYQKAVLARGVTLTGGAAGGVGGSSGGAAGKGGQHVELDCQSINFTGTIDVSGQAGGAGGASTGGGGGGGGGTVAEYSPNYIANTGTIVVTGGLGGAIGTGTSTAGGNGGNGWSVVFLP